MSEYVYLPQTIVVNPLRYDSVHEMEHFIKMYWADGNAVVVFNPLTEAAHQATVIRKRFLWWTYHAIEYTPFVFGAEGDDE